MTEKQDYLEGAKDALDIGSVLFSPNLASAHALIAIAERLGKQNELLERIAIVLEGNRFDELVRRGGKVSNVKEITDERRYITTIGQACKRQLQAVGIVDNNTTAFCRHREYGLFSCKENEIFNT